MSCNNNYEQDSGLPGNKARSISRLRSTKHKRLRRSGFSLMELMVVIVILGLLAATVTVGVQKYLLMGKTTAAKLNIAKFNEAIESYNTEKGRYPTEQEGLQVLVTEGWLNDGIPKDPWGNEYEYFLTTGDDERFEVICFGADGREGGTGKNKDISSRESSDS